MVAVFLKDSSVKKHRVLKTVNKNIYTFLVGDSVGKRRIKRLASPFGGDYLLYGIDPVGLIPFPTDEYKIKLLFIKFAEYVATKRDTQSKVGIIDKNGRFFDRLPEIQANCRSLTVLTEAEYGDIADVCFKRIGAAPEFCEKSVELFDCDTIFAADGLTGYDGVLFGKGGITAAVDRSSLPSYCRYALDSGADPTELAALLTADEPSLII